MEIIVVHCPTQEIWNAVQKRTVENGTIWCHGKRENDEWAQNNEESCIIIGSSMSYCSKKWAKDNGYAITSAEDYLNGYKYKPLKTKENKMNETIRKVFKGDTLELAEKMEENFGCEVTEDFTGELILATFRSKYIEEIVRREEEAKKEEKSK